MRVSKERPSGRRGSRSLDVPQFGNETPAGLRLMSALTGRRWFRWLGVGALVVLVTCVIYFQIAVAPELTARRFGVEVGGQDGRLVVEVDEEAPLVAVSGGTNGLSEVIATNDSLLVLATEVGADSDERWVSVPLTDLERVPAAFDAHAIADALSVAVKHCRPLEDAALELVSIMLPYDESAAGSDQYLCGTAFRNDASSGKVTVDVKDRRPSDLASRPTDSVIPLGSVSNKNLVLAELNERLAGA